jgi:hypothetical protein
VSFVLDDQAEAGNVLPALARLLLDLSERDNPQTGTPLAHHKPEAPEALDPHPLDQGNEETVSNGKDTKSGRQW